MAASKRLKIEFNKLQREAVPLVVARPIEKNILEWRFLMKGVDDYEGGYYMGKLKFPPEYPFKPPSIFFLTPNGRFATNTRICLSISDFHPELWTPSWTVGTILTGVVSFFNCEERTAGSVVATAAQRREMAAQSVAWNLRDKCYVELFGREHPEVTLFPRTTTETTREDAVKKPAETSLAPTPTAAAPTVFITSSESTGSGTSFEMDASLSAGSSDAKDRIDGSTTGEEKTCLEEDVNEVVQRVASTSL